MPYQKTIWINEVLSGLERFNIKTDSGDPIESNVGIELSTPVAVPGTPVTAEKMNNLEDEVERLSKNIRDGASQITIASDTITVSQSAHKIQPESGTTDDLASILGTTNGQSGVLYAADYGIDVITIRHGVGNILCLNNFDIVLSNGCVFWYSDGIKVFILGVGLYAALTHNHDLEYAALSHAHAGSDITSGTIGASHLPTATDSASGIVELATAAEVTTGTDGARVITPDTLAGSDYGKRIIEIPLNVVELGDGKAYARISSALNGYNLVSVAAAVVTKSTSGNPTWQVARGRQASATSAHTFVDMLSTPLTIDQDEYDSKDATTAAVINIDNDDVVTGDLIRLDCDVVGTGTANAVIELTFQLP